MVKRIISIMTSVMLAAGLVTITGFASGTELSGSCGDDAKWFINTDDVLVISGTGSTTQGEYLQWKDYGEDVKRVLIEEGITELSSYDFYYCKNASEIIFPSTVMLLGGCMSSENLEKLEDIWIFSKNVENSKLDGYGGYYPRPGSGVKWHIYAGSTTETSLRDGLKLTDDDFVYITESEKIPEVTNRTPAVIPELTETSGPCGLHSSWSWNEDTKTLTFKGSGSIAISKDFQKFADKIENAEMKDSEITSICDGSFGISNPYTQSVLCPKLNSVTFPSTLKTIGNYAFSQTALDKENIELPEGLERIGEQAFYRTRLSGALNLPSTMKYIGQQAFDSTNISSLKLVEGMKFSGTVFARCNNLKEVTIPVGCTYSKNGEGNAMRSNKLFGWCEGLEKVIIEDGAAIADSMFTGCTALKDVYILTKTGSVNISKKVQAESAFGGTPIYHIYKGSTAETALKSADYLTDDNFVYLADTTELEKAIADGEAVDAAKYTDDSMKVLTDAITAAKTVMENIDVAQADIDNAVTVIENAVKGLTEKPTEPEPPKSDTTKPEPSNPTTKTPSKTTTPKATRSKEAVKKDKSAAKKAMKQAKITKLKVKSKSKKKINVSWKKVKKAKGYQVQVSAKKNFKKVIFKKDIKKTKLTIKNKKIKSKKTYFVRIRAYATYKDTNNKTIKVYSKWNKKLRKVTVK